MSCILNIPNLSRIFKNRGKKIVTLEENLLPHRKFILQSNESVFLPHGNFKIYTDDMSRIDCEEIFGRREMEKYMIDNVVLNRLSFI